MRSGGQTFEIDSGRGVVHVKSEGMWTPEQARAHFMELEIAVRPLRVRNIPLIFLVDMRDAAVQSQQTANAMRSGARHMHRSNDIVAVITSSALTSLQVKAGASVTQLETFHDLAEAVRWAEAQRVPAGTAAARPLHLQLSGM